jgi:hypothetical protein
VIQRIVDVLQAVPLLVLVRTTISATETDGLETVRSPSQQAAE